MAIADAVLIERFLIESYFRRTKTISQQTRTSFLTNQSELEANIYVTAEKRIRQKCNWFRTDNSNSNWLRKCCVFLFKLITELSKAKPKQMRLFLTLN